MATKTTNRDYGYNGDMAGEDIVLTRDEHIIIAVDNCSFGFLKSILFDSPIPCKTLCIPCSLQTSYRMAPVGNAATPEHRFAA